jgi:sterol desaturase/sphingolipid hydroxylase (fatty acid hydroxylase superfamily)
MFKSNLLEALSKVPFYVPLIVYIPVIGYCIYRAFETAIGLGTFFGYMLLGLFVWTFTEYILHRFVFHYLPKPKWGQRLHFIFHGVHHDYPSDALRLVMPPSASIPLAIAFYYLFRAMLPVNYIYAFFPGFIVGYLFYDISHYAIHHFNFKANFWKKIKQHHMLHHYQDPTKGYGVSSPLWDKIFRSDFIKK